MKSLLNTIDNIKHKAIVYTLYSTGLRLQEALNLKVKDIDSKRMLLRVGQGKGRKDRYVMLAKKLLQVLREYYKQAYSKANTYLFPGSNPLKHIHARYVQMLCAKDCAGGQIQGWD